MHERERGRGRERARARAGASTTGLCGVALTFALCSGGKLQGVR